MCDASRVAAAPPFLKEARDVPRFPASDRPAASPASRSRLLGLQAFGVGNVQAAMLRLPTMQRCRRNPMLAGQVACLRTRLVLVHNRDDLTFVNHFRFISPSFNRGRTPTPSGGKTQQQVTTCKVCPYCGPLANGGHPSSWTPTGLQRNTVQEADAFTNLQHVPL